jgi:hypothetical protein
VTVPEAMIWVPTMDRIRVVLPHPEGPSNPVMVPRGMVTETSVNALRLPRVTCRFSITIAGPESPAGNSSCDELIM